MCFTGASYSLAEDAVATKCLGKYVCMRRCSTRQMYETSKNKMNKDRGSRYIEIKATQHQCNFFCDSFVPKINLDIKFIVKRQLY